MRQFYINCDLTKTLNENDIRCYMNLIDRTEKILISLMCYKDESVVISFKLL